MAMHPHPTASHCEEGSDVAIPSGDADGSGTVSMDFRSIHGIATPVCALARNDHSGAMRPHPVGNGLDRSEILGLVHLPAMRAGDF